MSSRTILKTLQLFLDFIEFEEFHTDIDSTDSTLYLLTRSHFSHWRLSLSTNQSLVFREFFRSFWSSLTLILILYWICRPVFIISTKIIQLATKRPLTSTGSLSNLPSRRTTSYYRLTLKKKKMKSRRIKQINYKVAVSPIVCLRTLQLLFRVGSVVQFRSSGNEIAHVQAIQLREEAFLIKNEDLRISRMGALLFNWSGCESANCFVSIGVYYSRSNQSTSSGL